MESVFLNRKNFFARIHQLAGGHFLTAYVLFFENKQFWVHFKSVGTRAGYEDGPIGCAVFLLFMPGVDL